VSAGRKGIFSQRGGGASLRDVASVCCVVGDSTDLGKAFSWRGKGKGGEKVRAEVSLASASGGKARNGWLLRKRKKSQQKTGGGKRVGGLRYDVRYTSLLPRTDPIRGLRKGGSESDITIMPVTKNIVGPPSAKGGDDSAGNKTKKEGTRQDTATTAGTIASEIDLFRQKDRRRGMERPLLFQERIA